VPRHLGKSPSTPPCPGISWNCLGRGRQDLVARDAADEPRHRSRSAHGHLHTRVQRVLDWVGQAKMVVGQASSARPMGRSRPSTVWQCFFLFFIFDYSSRNWYKFKKCVENAIRLKKYETNFYRIITSRFWF
jgi:hypothetical protein